MPFDIESNASLQAFLWRFVLLGSGHCHVVSYAYTFSLCVQCEFLSFFKLLLLSSKRVFSLLLLISHVRERLFEDRKIVLSCSTHSSPHAKIMHRPPCGKLKQTGSKRFSLSNRSRSGRTISGACFFLDTFFAFF